jgi:hypothetical protein
MKTLLGLFLTLFLFTSTANALIYVEPFAGMSKVSWDTSSALDATKGVFGGRLGLSAMMFTVGAEYAKADSWDKTAAFVAFKPIVIPLRVYGRYFIDTGLVDSKGEDYTGYGLGVGFTGLPFISINLDYNSYSDDSSLSNNASEMMLTLSLPFDFL